MKNEIKCPHCGAWNVWDNQLDEKCFACGSFLAKQEIEKEELKKEREKKDTPFELSPEDRGIKRVLKSIARASYLIIMSIVSVIMAIIFWLPG